MEVSEYPPYQSVHGVVQQMNAGSNQQPHQPSLSPQQQISLQQQIPHGPQQQLLRQQMPNQSPVSPRMTQHHSMVQQQHQMGHHSHSVNLQQQGPPLSPHTPHTPAQNMYPGNHIQQLAGGVMPEFFGYAGGNDYNSQMQMISPSDVQSPPQDLNASWYNFMAQFRQ